MNAILTWNRTEDGYRNVSRIIEKPSTYVAAKTRNPKSQVTDQLIVNLVFAAVKDRCIGFYSNISNHFYAGTLSSNHNRVRTYPRVSLNSLLITTQMGQPMEFVNTIN